MKRRALFLDVGWTLIYPERSLWETLAHVATSEGTPVSGATCEASIQPLWQAAQVRAVSEFHADADYPDSDEEFIGLFRQLGQIVLTAVGVDGHSGRLVERFVDAMGDWNQWRVFDEVPHVLARLRADGFVLAAVSNATADLPQFMEHLGLAGFFDVIVASAAEGRKKPDRRLFELALERTGVVPSDAMHVGDLALEDILGARSAGVSAVLMHRGSRSLFPSFPPYLPAEAAGTPLVSNLIEVLELVR